ncbi:hypothetical protein C2E23DRAFT_39817 [Lenzites betulinus]|nr:hypothetical protein C2E23DRAFT_39817 [Lenzites betulinus]
MASSNPLVYVDESDPRIVYSDGWALYPSTVAYGGTLHFAVDAGTTASLTFNGTRVGVYGCGGDTNQYGWPEESFVVDGKTYLIRTDPTATPNTQFFNVSFFTSPALDPGEHTLVVTNINGTAPNRLWLDWFWFDAVVDTTSASPSASGNAAPTSSSGIPTSSSNGTNGTSAPLNTAVATSSSPASSSGVTSSSSHSQNLGAIIGGAVGGAMALLILGVLGAFCFFKRRSARYQRGAREVCTLGQSPYR